jgi:hypothetical protein
MSEGFFVAGALRQAVTEQERNVNDIHAFLHLMHLNANGLQSIMVVE